MIYTPEMDCIKSLEVGKDHLAFLAEWLEWAEVTPAGHSSAFSDIFWTDYGLCANYDSWRINNRTVSAFEFVALPEAYPFGSREYQKDYLANTQHKNPTRLSWVKAVLECHTPKVHLDSVITVEVVECGSMPPADSGTLL